MTQRQIPDLRPEMIGRIFGRTKSPSGGIPSRVMFRVSLALSLFVGVLALAFRYQVLLIGPGSPWVLRLLVRPGEVTVAQLPFLGDPVSILLLYAAIATPFFTYRQVVAISRFVEMNETNVAYRARELRVAALHADVARANRQFRIVGTRTVSLLILIAAAAGSYLLYRLIETQGLYASWNFTPLPDGVWRRIVYQGWWANRGTHPEQAVALWLIGTYFFYFLVKQLSMGATFARFARAALHHDFGVAQSSANNRDGYWGLRELRYFMQWTYLSTITHFIITLGVFVVWLPMRQWTILLVAGVMIFNFLVVFYPSQVAFSSSVREKKRFVAHTIATVADSAERERLIERVWATPNLPFRLRSTFTAVTVYLLIPLTLAIVSTVLSRI